MKKSVQSEVLEYHGLTEEHQAPLWVCDSCGAEVCDGADMAVIVDAMQALKARAQAALPPPE